MNSSDGSLTGLALEGGASTSDDESDAGGSGWAGGSCGAVGVVGIARSSGSAALRLTTTSRPPSAALFPAMIFWKVAKLSGSTRMNLMPIPGGSPPLARSGLRAQTTRPTPLISGDPS